MFKTVKTFLKKRFMILYYSIEQIFQYLLFNFFQSPNTMSHSSLKSGKCTKLITAYLKYFLRISSEIICNY
jgi:hypothetical protein